MENKRKYIITGSEGELVSGFPSIDLNYRKTKEEAWAELSAQIDTFVLKPRQKFTLYSKFALAASILLILGITTFLRFYTITASCPAGKHLAVSLPDGSQVELNAQSAITYHPYWLKHNRSVELEGEAYFKVKNGERFKVISTHGETSVMGTSFNIYSRGSDYKVSCFTGAVKVLSLLNRESVIVYPNQQAFIQKDGSIRLVESDNIETSKAWTRDMFVFTGTPLKSVIEEIERQYNIKITTTEDYHLTYTGNFSKSISEKEVLDLVCTSLELKFEVKSNGEYLIYKYKR